MVRKHVYNAASQSKTIMHCVMHKYNALRYALLLTIMSGKDVAYCILFSETKLLGPPRIDGHIGL